VNFNAEEVTSYWLV